MGTIGGLVVPLILAAAIGFAVGWFFARAGRKPEGAGAGAGAGAGGARTLVEDVGTGSADTDQRVALLEADYARRVEVFSKREAELITAGRKVVEQLRRREAELAGQRGDASSIDPALSPRAVERSSPETAEVPVAAAAAAAAAAADDDDDDEPRPSDPLPADAIPSDALAPKRSRRAVIDPATGRPIEAAEPEPEAALTSDARGASPTASPQPRAEAAVADPTGRPSAELSVRLIAPALRREEPQVIDLRERRPTPPSADLATPAPGRAAELTDIIGIGPKTVDQLRLAGVVSLADLACLDPAGPLPTSIEGLRSRLRRGDWVGQARRLTGRPLS